MSGIQTRLNEAQTLIENQVTTELTNISIRTGPFTTATLHLRNENSMYPTGGDRWPGTQIYGITFKHIPASEPQGPDELKRVEGLLRSRHPTYQNLMKALFESNRITGNFDDTNSWYYGNGSAEYIRVPPSIPHQISHFVKTVLLASSHTRSTPEFQTWASEMNIVLSKRYAGYDAFKRQVFEGRNFQGQFEDALSWKGLEHHDNLEDFRMPFDMCGFLKALGKGSPFYISDQDIVVRLRGTTVKEDQMRQAAKKFSSIHALISNGPKGLLVNDNRRLLIYFYFVIVIVTITVSAIMTDWLNGPFEVAGCILTLMVSIPALWSFMSNEQDPVWAALRGQRYLYDDKDVVETFGITQLEVAIYGLVDGGCPFLSNERMSHNPDKGTNLIKPGPNALTATEDLRKVGIFVGNHMARRVWEDTNYTVVRNNNQELHITDQPSKTIWSTGVRSEIGVG